MILLEDSLAQHDQQRSKLRVATAERDSVRRNSFAVALAELRSPLEASYRNSFYCSAWSIIPSGKVIQRRCRNRWCSRCSKRKSEEAFRHYFPMLELWDQPYFVTLTLPTVDAPRLSEQIDRITKEIGRIAICMKRSHEQRLIAVRKLECTISTNGQYHPHWHLLVDGERAAELLHALWLKRFPEAKETAQNIQYCSPDDLPMKLEYLLKDHLHQSRRQPSYGEYDVMFRALHRRRALQFLGQTRNPRSIDQVNVHTSDEVHFG